MLLKACFSEELSSLVDEYNTATPIPLTCRLKMSRSDDSYLSVIS
jgi:hypothetical protein